MLSLQERLLFLQCHDQPKVTLDLRRGSGHASLDRFDATWSKSTTNPTAEAATVITVPAVCAGGLLHQLVCSSRKHSWGKGIRSALGSLTAQPVHIGCRRHVKTYMGHTAHLHARAEVCLMYGKWHCCWPLGLGSTYLQGCTAIPVLAWTAEVIPSMLPVTRRPACICSTHVSSCKMPRTPWSGSCAGT
jgi:hypothetical protein